MKPRIKKYLEDNHASKSIPNKTYENISYKNISCEEGIVILKASIEDLYIEEPKTLFQRLKIICLQIL